MIGEQNHCVNCEKPVYYAEQVKFQRDYYHKACFKCDSCEKVLSNVASAHDTKEGFKYCGSCYRKVNGPKGYGFGPGIMQPSSKATKEREREEELKKDKQVEAEERRKRTGRMSYGGGGEKCKACAKTVYFAEQHKALGNMYHKACFKCNSCGKVLSSVAEVNDKEGELYCKTCYGKNFGPKGVGFGNALTSTT